MEIISSSQPDFLLLLTMLLLHHPRQHAVAFVLPSATTRHHHHLLGDALTSLSPSRLNERDHSFRPQMKRSFSQLSFQSGESIAEKLVGSEGIPSIGTEIINIPLEQKPIQELPIVVSSTDKTRDTTTSLNTIKNTMTAPIVLPASSSATDNIQQSTVQKKIIIPSPGIDTTTATKTDTVEVTNNTKQQQQLIMPTTTSIRNKETTSMGPVKKRLKVIQIWCKSWIYKALHWRPGMKFRIRLATATLSAFAITSWFLPRLTGGVQLIGTLQTWLSSRGFQGIAAFGRSVAYGWALFVGYPRLLDRRAKEQRRRSEEKALERRRTSLHRLANEVARLRQELATIDKEIRAFRREIIKMKAYAPKSSNSLDDDNGFDPDIQEAISSEMAHLAQLRSDVQTSLAAARQTWAEARSKSPPEAWDGDHLELTI